MPSLSGSSTNLQVGPRGESETRALLRIMSTQAANANPIVALVAISMIYTMHDRVAAPGLLTWAGLTVLVGTGLMGLVFLSSRSGMDEEAGRPGEEDEQDR